MRPDPWQQEKSRKYQLKNKAKLKKRAAKDSEKEKPANSQNKTVGGFKFVNPVQISVSNIEKEAEESEIEEDEYDIVDFNEVNIADMESIMSSLQLNEITFKGLVLNSGLMTLG